MSDNVRARFIAQRARTTSSMTSASRSSRADGARLGTTDRRRTTLDDVADAGLDGAGVEFMPTALAHFVPTFTS